jgi:hypothetical protein
MREEEGVEGLTGGLSLARSPPRLTRHSQYSPPPKAQAAAGSDT